MMKKINKRGISPVVATVLLIMLGVILVSIIFVWARQFIAEQISRSGSNIGNSCKDVAFEADLNVSDGVRMDAINTGNVLIYGFSVRVIRLGTIEECYVPELWLKKDQFIQNTKLSGCEIDCNVGKVLVLPVLLGEGEDAKNAFTCPEINGKEVDITC